MAAQRLPLLVMGVEANVLAARRCPSGGRQRANDVTSSLRFITLVPVCENSQDFMFTL